MLNVLRPWYEMVLSQARGLRRFEQSTGQFPTSPLVGEVGRRPGEGSPSLWAVDRPLDTVDQRRSICTHEPDSPRPRYATRRCLDPDRAKKVPSRLPNPSLSTSKYGVILGDLCCVPLGGGRLRITQRLRLASVVSRVSDRPAEMSTVSALASWTFALFVSFPKSVTECYSVLLISKNLALSHSRFSAWCPDSLATPSMDNGIEILRTKVPSTGQLKCLSDLLPERRLAQGTARFSNSLGKLTAQ